MSRPISPATAIGLTKSGSATAVLTGANSYTGRTTVTGGTLQLASNAQNCVLNLGGADMQSGGLVFDYAGGSDPAATIRGLLLASYRRRSLGRRSIPEHDGRQRRA